MSSHNPPVVLVFAGSDPTGGAGVQADIEAIVSLGCHAAPVITAVTAQDTVGVKQFASVDTELVIAQARAVLEDMPVAAAKTGMLGNKTILSAVVSILSDYPRIPLVVDPVQAAGTGDPLTEHSLDEAMRTVLLPRATLATPNTLEAQNLAPGADTPDACAQELMSLGCEYVLTTGAHDTSKVINRLYGHLRLLETFECERLDHNYHGSGCTVAAACSAGLAHGLDPVSAVAKALDYTWQSLKQGYRPGMGQFLPDRLYWAREYKRSHDD
ncbi:MAG: hydroxymethylpyrimidine/phosphomethylpyrimidine kinase [Gammaproteobacteria bacterium]|nr:hydroxymethylpyrimidine/phosphomethylpyrimidine kinase [Gammaproteobacteria bacterium]